MAALQEDSFLLQCYYLADMHHWPLSTVMSMTLDEFAGWIAFLEIKQRNRADG